MHLKQIPQHHAPPKPQTYLVQSQMLSLLAVPIAPLPVPHNQDVHLSLYRLLYRPMATHTSLLKPVLDVLNHDLAAIHSH